MARTVKPGGKPEAKGAARTTARGPGSRPRVEAVLRELEREGTAQTRKVYARHGVRGEAFGVSYAALGRIRRKVGVNQEIADALWETGNHDARVLATMVADPAKLTAKKAATWARALDNYLLTDALSSLVARSPSGRRLAERWSAGKAEWTGAAGWNILTTLAMNHGPGDDDYWGGHLNRIEERIHRSANRVRYSMNNTLIAIGSRNARLRKAALKAAKRIGGVEVDHGETGCRTPDAAAYIRKMAQRKAARITRS